MGTSFSLTNRLACRFSCYNLRGLPGEMLQKDNPLEEMEAHRGRQRWGLLQPSPFFVAHPHKNGQAGTSELKLICFTFSLLILGASGPLHKSVSPGHFSR